LANKQGAVMRGDNPIVYWKKSKYLLDRKLERVLFVILILILIYFL